MVSFIKNVIIILGLVALAGIGYYLFVVERNATVATTDFRAGGGITADTEVLLRRLADIQNIQLSGEVFNDPKFRSLEDFSTVVDRVPLSRDLPFTENTTPISILDTLGN